MCAEGVAMLVAHHWLSVVMHAAVSCRDEFVTLPAGVGDHRVFLSVCSWRWSREPSVRKMNTVPFWLAVAR